MKLLVECQRHIIYVKVGMFNYCFIRVSDYMLVFVMVVVSRFRRVAYIQSLLGCRVAPSNAKSWLRHCHPLAMPLYQLDILKAFAFNANVPIAEIRLVIIKVKCMFLVK